MIVFTKIITSAFAIFFITETAKKCPTLGGLIAVMPINIILSMIWLNIETKNLKMLSNFTNCAILGVIPTLIFLLALGFLLNKNIKLNTSLLISLCLWCTFIVIQNQVITK